MIQEQMNKQQWIDDVLFQLGFDLIWHVGIILDGFKLDDSSQLVNEMTIMLDKMNTSFAKEKEHLIRLSETETQLGFLYNLFISNSFISVPEQQCVYLFNLFVDQIETVQMDLPDELSLDLKEYVLYVLTVHSSIQLPKQLL